MNASRKRNQKRMTEKLPILIGTWLQIGHPIVAEIAAYKDFDWICIDLEHSPTTLETMANMFRAITAANSDIMLTVRVPDHNPKIIGRCLDAGAECIIVPQVNTFIQAKEIVLAAKYSYDGQRGHGYARCNRYGSDEMVDRCKIIVQIEHYSTINNDLGSMMAHPQIDGAFIGPLDLAATLPSARQKDHQMMVLTEKFRVIVKKHNKYIGIHIIEPNSSIVSRVIRAGYNFIALGVDTSLLSKSMDNLFMKKEE